MTLILLYGTGSNWLPLLYPAIVTFVLSYGTGHLVKYIKRRKLYRENRLVEKYISRNEQKFN